jgi:hypothetical protein
MKIVTFYFLFFALPHSHSNVKINFHRSIINRLNSRSTINTQRVQPPANSQRCHQSKQTNTATDTHAHIIFAIIIISITWIDKHNNGIAFIKSSNAIATNDITNKFIQ